jgi:hypothetical protein
VDIFAYVILGIFALVVVIYLARVLWVLGRDPIGRSILGGIGLIVFVIAVVVSAVWLIGTKLI